MTPPFRTRWSVMMFADAAAYLLLHSYIGTDKSHCKKFWVLTLTAGKGQSGAFCIEFSPKILESCFFRPNTKTQDSFEIARKQ